MEKRNNEIFMQSPGRRYLAMPGKLLRRTTTYQWEDQFHAMEQEKMGCLGRKQESKFNQECGPTFCVIGEAQILCFA